MVIVVIVTSNTEIPSAVRKIFDVWQLFIYYTLTSFNELLLIWENNFVLRLWFSLKISSQLMWFSWILAKCLLFRFILYFDINDTIYYSHYYFNIDEYVEYQVKMWQSNVSPFVRLSVRYQHFQNLKVLRVWDCYAEVNDLGVYVLWVWEQKALGSRILNFRPCTVRSHPELSPVGRNERPREWCYY